MSPKKLLSQDEVFNLSIEEIKERIAAEQAFMNKQKHKKFFAATHGSKKKWWINQSDD